MVTHYNFWKPGVQLEPVSVSRQRWGFSMFEAHRRFWSGEGRPLLLLRLPADRREDGKDMPPGSQTRKRCCKPSWIAPCR